MLFRSHVKALFLVGATANAIKEAVVSHPNYNENALPVKIFETLKDTVSYAKDFANAGDVVTMSPACASFDLYKHFMERGDIFKEIVNQL